MEEPLYVVETGPIVVPAAVIVKLSVPPSLTEVVKHLVVQPVLVQFVVHAVLVSVVSLPPMVTVTLAGVAA